MPTTFQKRQKEMKRQEKQKMKLERRAQKKLSDGENGASSDGVEELKVLDAPQILEEFMDLPVLPHQNVKR
jgi:hypothetical protein